MVPSIAASQRWTVHLTTAANASTVYGTCPCAENERRDHTSVNETSPICFRVSSEERKILVAVAMYVGESLSAFMRHAAVETAQAVMEQAGGDDAVLRHYDEVQRRREDFTSRE